MLAAVMTRADILAAARRTAWGGAPLEREGDADADAYLLRRALLTGAGVWR